MSAADQPGEIVKWYTRARRFPQLIGKTPDGASLWGGPYTYSQVIAATVVLYVGIHTVHLWGRFGMIGNALTLAAVTYGLVLLIGRLPVGSRNPASIAAGALRAISSPASGHHAGRAVRIRPPHRVRSALVVQPAVRRSPEAPDPATRGEVDPGAVRSSAVPVSPRLPALTGVQRLLASTGPTSARNS